MSYLKVLQDIHENIFEAAEQNDRDRVKWFIEDEGTLPNVTDEYNRSPAHIASMYGHLDIVKYLLERDASVLTLDDFYGHTVLMKAIMNGHLNVVKYLCEYYKSNITQRSSSRHGGDTAIHFAAKHGRIDILKYFIEGKKADVNIENDFGETPIFSAAEVKYQNMPIFKYLDKEKNADLLKIDIFGKNILYTAVDSGDLPLIKYILDERGAPLNPNWRDLKGNALVHRAAFLNRLAVLDYLLRVKGVEVNIVNESGDTPLHIAAQKNHIEICERLVEVGNASTEIKDRNGMPPVRRATQAKVIAYLKAVSGKRSRRSIQQSRRFSTVSFSHGMPRICQPVR